MTPKMVKYVEARKAGLPPRQAAIDAGYAPTGADAAASNLEKRADVQAALKSKAKPKENPEASAGGRRGKAARMAEALQKSDEKAESYLRDHYDSPLDLLLHVMNEPKAADSLRVMCAKDAAPYVHGKVAPAASKGKKAEAEDRAKDKATTGKFRRRAAPSKPAVRLN